MFLKHGAKKVNEIEMVAPTGSARGTVPRLWFTLKYWRSQREPPVSERISAPKTSSMESKKFGELSPRCIAHQ
jgi:hypothetical protein